MIKIILGTVLTLWVLSFFVLVIWTYAVSPDDKIFVLSFLNDKTNKVKDFFINSLLKKITFQNIANVLLAVLIFLVTLFEFFAEKFKQYNEFLTKLTKKFIVPKILKIEKIIVKSSIIFFTIILEKIEADLKNLEKLEV